MYSLAAVKNNREILCIPYQFPPVVISSKPVLNITASTWTLTAKIQTIPVTAVIPQNHDTSSWPLATTNFFSLIRSPQFKNVITRESYPKQPFGISSFCPQHSSPETQPDCCGCPGGKVRIFPSVFKTFFFVFCFLGFNCDVSGCEFAWVF